jgi:hypothetical protein
MASGYGERRRGAWRSVDAPIEVVVKVEPERSEYTDMLRLADEQRGSRAAERRAHQAFLDAVSCINIYKEVPGPEKEPKK